MGRKSLPMTSEITPEQALAPDLMNNLNALAEHQQAIMEKCGAGLPYERKRIVYEARFYIAQSAEAMLEAGKRLIILKENEPHGEFTKVITNQLGLNYGTAARIMQATIKYMNPKLAPNLSTFLDLGKSKLYELMLEDDDDLAELAEGGTIAGLTLDEVDRMSVRELRLAIRQSRKKLAETEKDLERSRLLAAQKEEKINALTQYKPLNRTLD